jgi:hypothetical protein
MRPLTALVEPSHSAGAALTATIDALRPALRSELMNLLYFRQQRAALDPSVVQKRAPE